MRRIALRTLRSAFVIMCGLAAVAPALPAVERPGPPAASSRAGGPVGIRAMTYNIHAGAGDDGRLDLERTAVAIEAAGPDVVSLQEVDVHWGERSAWQDQAALLAERLDMRVFFGRIYDLPGVTPQAPRRRFGIALLSRLPVLAAENHELTRLSTQQRNPVPAPAPGFPEITVGLRGTRLHVYGTHLDYRADPSVRTLQIADTLRILGEDGAEPQLLLGDFNAEPTAPELAPLWGRMTDACAVAGPCGPTYPARDPRKYLDYVTVSAGIGVRRAEVLDTSASDHRPVVADLTVPRTAPGARL
ncbi:endonuclease/exonuclease/phosphatase family protein [Streptomyces sp. NPDC054861]